MAQHLQDGLHLGLGGEVLVAELRGAEGDVVVCSDGAQVLGLDVHARLVHEDRVRLVQLL